jgi:hypothetical protein
METIAVPPRLATRLVIGIDPGQHTGFAWVRWRGRTIDGAFATTLHAETPSALSSDLLGRIGSTFSLLSHDEFVVASEGWAWYGKTPGRVHGLAAAAYASGFVAGLVEACRISNPKIGSTLNLTRGTILKALGLPTSTSKYVAAQRVRQLLPANVQVALDGVSEHAYDAVAVALAADAVRENPLAGRTKARRGTR